DSLSAIATACLRLFTLWPEPECSSPSLNLRISCSMPLFPLDTGISMHRERTLRHAVGRRAVAVDHLNADQIARRDREGMRSIRAEGGVGRGRVGRAGDIRRRGAC